MQHKQYNKNNSKTKENKAMVSLINESTFSLANEAFSCADIQFLICIF